MKRIESLFLIWEFKLEEMKLIEENTRSSLFPQNLKFSFPPKLGGIGRNVLTFHSFPFLYFKTSKHGYLIQFNSIHFFSIHFHYLNTFNFISLLSNPLDTFGTLNRDYDMNCTLYY